MGAPSSSRHAWFDRGLVRDIQAQLLGVRNQVKIGRELATLGANRPAQDRHWRRSMKRFARLAVLGFALAAATTSANAQTPTDKPVVRLDPALDALVSPDAKLERLATGFGFTEGNIWVPQGKPRFTSG
jgi:hypothetical protein